LAGVPTPPGRSWNFFSEFSRTWKVLKNAFGPGKCGKSKLKFLASPGVYSERTTDSTEFCDGQF